MINEELVYLYQQGDNSALELILEQNKGIIHKMINRYYINTSIVDKEDLFQEGCIGLMLATKKYDFNNPKKCKFTTYAVYWINSKISRYLTTRNTSCEISLETPVGDEVIIADLLKDDLDIEENCIESVYNAELRKNLYNSMYKVNTLLERQILELNYGLNHTEPMTFKNIAEVLKTDVKTVRINKTRAINKLRNSPVQKKYRGEMIEARRQRKYYNVDNLTI